MSVKVFVCADHHFQIGTWPDATVEVVGGVRHNGCEKCGRAANMALDFAHEIMELDES